MKKSVIKRIVLLSLFILIATTLYVYVVPRISFEKKIVDDPEMARTILDFANTQMDARYIKIPGSAKDWIVEEVQLLSIKVLPGSQNKRRVRCRLYGGYKTKADLGTPESSHSFYQKNTFLISDKYPEGLSVQLER